MTARAVRLMRRTWVTDASRYLQPGEHEVSEDGPLTPALADYLIGRGRARPLSPEEDVGQAASLPSDDDLRGLLGPLDDKGRESYWEAFDEAALNDALAERFGEPKKARPHGTAANMIEKRLGL